MKTYMALILICSVLLISCKDKSIEPSGNITMSGEVILISEYGDTLTDASNVKVQVANTSVSTLSESNGKWALSNIPLGEFRLEFSKEGFGSTVQRVYNSGRRATQSTLQNYLCQCPTYTIESLAAQVSTSDHSITIVGTVSAPSRTSYGKEVVLYFRKDSAVSYLPNEYDFYKEVNVESGKMSFSKTVLLSELIINGILQGDTVYCIAYPAGEGPLHGYNDAVYSWKVVLTSIGQTGSNKVSLVAP